MLSVMVFNATFNNISAMSWQSEHPEKTTDLPHVTDQHYTSCCIKYTSPWAGFQLTRLVVMGTDYTGSCKSNYHTTTTAPILLGSIFANTTK
jgi:hypothetical protein